MITPRLPLFKSERLYWPVLVERKTTEWSELENLFACAMCKDLALIEELAREYPVNELMRDVCRRIYEAAELLKLDRDTTKRDSAPQRLVSAFFEAA